MNARRIIGPPFPEKDTRLPVTSTYATSEQPARMRRIGVLIAIAILKEIRSMEDKDGNRYEIGQRLPDHRRSQEKAT